MKTKKIIIFLITFLVLSGAMSQQKPNKSPQTVQEKLLYHEILSFEDRIDILQNRKYISPENRKVIQSLQDSVVTLKKQLDSLFTIRKK